MVYLKNIGSMNLLENRSTIRIFKVYNRVGIVKNIL